MTIPQYTFPGAQGFVFLPQGGASYTVCFEQDGKAGRTLCTGLSLKDGWHLRWVFTSGERITMSGGGLRDMLVAMAKARGLGHELLDAPSARAEYGSAIIDVRNVLLDMNADLTRSAEVRSAITEAFNRVGELMGEPKSIKPGDEA